MEEVIPNLIKENLNATLKMMLSSDEIIQAIFSLNGNNATSPYGYGAPFFQAY